MDLRTPQEPSRRPPGSSLGDGLHFAKGCEPLERVALDLPNPLARETEAEPHVLERLGFDAAESVAEHEHLAVAIRQRRQRLRKRLSAERDVGLLLGQWVVAGDEVAEERVLLLADRLVEARARPRGRAHLVRLLERQVRLLGDLLQRRLATELRPERPLR